VDEGARRECCVDFAQIRQAPRYELVRYNI
jgi:hypothetical protein